MQREHKRPRSVIAECYVDPDADKGGFVSDHHLPPGVMILPGTESTKGARGKKCASVRTDKPARDTDDAAAEALSKRKRKEPESKETKKAVPWVWNSFSPEFEEVLTSQEPIPLFEPDSQIEMLERRQFPAPPGRDELWALDLVKRREVVSGDPVLCRLRTLTRANRFKLEARKTKHQPSRVAIEMFPESEVARTTRGILHVVLKNPLYVAAVSEDWTDFQVFYVPGRTCT